ncbi:glycosyl transferase [Gaertneriomyces sp. JEL0708]|nr:glycosyl transferase [Gaertneriomyces sp. JEL0708]
MPKDSPALPSFGSVSKESATIFIFATLIKLLLIPSYHSTDFEVHRNWLAITANLPLSKWYYENTSEWTLDYPPFFAWFEWSLAQIAKRVHPEMLNLHDLNYASWQTVGFQRLTVIVSEVVFFCGVLCLTRRVREKNERLIMTALLFLSPGILFVDHIHFQYNGMLYGIQLFSIAAMLENKPLLGGILFAIVLNFKHIYLYQAPAYFVYLLRSYCFHRGTFSVRNFVRLGASVIFVFAMSFGPFIKHIPQILSRLFPFKRGLCHAYWAPNFWALYAFADRLLIQTAKMTGGKTESLQSLTRGLVGDTAFAVLPDVSASATMVLTLLSQLPILTKLWMDPTPRRFIDALILCGFGSFLFGWHVHEKAVLLVLVPLSVIVRHSSHHARIFYLLACAGYYSLFPLLFAPTETVTKLVVFVVFVAFGWHFLAYLHRGQNGHSALRLPFLERLYIAGLFVLFAFTEIAHPIFDTTKRYAFLPLMLTSVYCSLGILYGWLQLYVQSMR